MKVRLEMLEGMLQRPAMPVELCHPFGRYLAWDISQDVEQRGSIAGRMIQCEPQTLQDALGTVFIHHTRVAGGYHLSGYDHTTATG
jgi:hypothetical protein